MPYCGLAAARVFGGRSASSSTATRRSRAEGGAAAAPVQLASRPWRWGAAACIALQLPLAAYMLLVHQG